LGKDKLFYYLDLLQITDKYYLLIKTVKSWTQQH